ncbi:unnamed protein product [Calypogeia fissa]
MPITVHPSTKQLSTVSKTYNRPALEATHLLARACEPVSEKCGEIFQCSFLPWSLAQPSSNPKPSERFVATATDLSKSTILPDMNGLVNTAVRAYSGHHHLVLRPDDVWIAILTQFSLFVNANAQELRHLFVEHEGKEHLVVTAVGSRYNVDFGAMAERMGHLIQQKVKDPDLREWIVPSFSTTTVNDLIVSSVVMMATLKAYFSYKFGLMCGLPAVTLLGEKADWEELVSRAEKLPSYGAQTAKWHSLLKPVLSGFVRSFEKPESQELKDFWQKIAHHSGGGSGPTYLSGWITAFCFFDKEGKPLHSDHAVGKKTNWDGSEVGNLTMDGVEYHRVDTTSIPPAYAEVDVKLNDNGVEMNTVMVAGLVAMEICSSGMKGGGHAGEDDSLQPVGGWWLFEEVEKKVNDAPRIL